MKIGVSVDITKAVAALDNLAKTQVPFAASKALNEAAQRFAWWPANYGTKRVGSKPSLARSRGSDDEGYAAQSQLNAPAHSRAA